MRFYAKTLSKIIRYRNLLQLNLIIWKQWCNFLQTFCEITCLAIRAGNVVYLTTLWRHGVDAALKRLAHTRATGGSVHSVSDMISPKRARNQHHSLGETCIKMNIYTANVIFPVRNSLHSQLRKYVENVRGVTENTAEPAAGAETCIPKLHQPQFGLVRALTHSKCELRIFFVLFMIFL